MFSNDLIVLCLKRYEAITDRVGTMRSYLGALNQTGPDDPVYPLTPTLARICEKYQDAF